MYFILDGVGDASVESSFLLFMAANSACLGSLLSGGGSDGAPRFLMAANSACRGSTALLLSVVFSEMLRLAPFDD